MKRWREPLRILMILKVVSKSPSPLTVCPSFLFKQTTKRERGQLLANLLRALKVVSKKISPPPPQQ